MKVIKIVDNSSKLSKELIEEAIKIIEKCGGKVTYINKNR